MASQAQGLIEKRPEGNVVIDHTLVPGHMEGHGPLKVAIAEHPHRCAASHGGGGGVAGLSH